MKKVIFLLFYFFTPCIYSQGIVIDTTSLTIPQLIETELLSNSCTNATNFLFSSHQGIGRFTNTNSGFPITTGIVIRNGIAKYTEGPYSGLNESSQLTSVSDANLQTISNSNGQSAPITDVAFLQFDFTPLSSNFSFDFLFASNEYGEFQCGFSDVFAFMLSDLTAGTAPVNLAVIPATTTPVSVKNIRNSAYNSACLSNNPSLFANYNVTNPTGSALNMRGETVLLNASSPVIPNNTYRIKLAIGDYLDSNYDSAVFIKGGSFTTTTDLGPDRTICQGESLVISSTLGPQFSYVWTQDGNVIVGETNASLVVTQPGTYGLTASLSTSNCVITDEIIFTDLTTITLPNLSVCNTGATTYNYDLTQNGIAQLGLNATEYGIQYYASQADAIANGPVIPAGLLNSYTSAGAQTIYIKVIHLTNGNVICNDLFSFDLIVNSPVTLGVTSPLNFCDTVSGNLSIDLTVENALVLDGQDPAAFTISYFLTQSDAQNNTNAITTAGGYLTTIGQSPLTFWVRMEDAASPTCFGVSSFVVTIYPIPLVDDIPNVIECNSFVLPPLTNGNYYTGTNGSGTMLLAGDTIDLGGIYYIYNGPIGPAGCSNQNSFTVTFIDELTFTLTACGQYIVPPTVAGGFFTGPGGTGVSIPFGTPLTTNQTIYFYAEFNSIPCRDEALPITVFPLPLVDDPADVVTCNSFTLPVLINGSYYSGPSGGGIPLSAGETINFSQDVFIFADDGTCTNENMFRVDIVDTSIYQPLSSCGSYTLPDVPIGGYFTQPFGGGTSIAQGTVITSSGTVYYYVLTTDTPNCTDNLSYVITINDLPVVDTPSNRLECQNYTLPPLTNGNYFTGTYGTGTALFSGDVISSTQNLYVYAINTNGCEKQHIFEVQIRSLPLVDNFTDVFSCTPFTLPLLTHGDYYTAPGGTLGGGTLIPDGTIITTTQTLYIYNQWSDLTTCDNESVFTVTVNNLEVGTFSDVNACDGYILPPLTVGNYYSQAAGVGPIIPAGTSITTSTTIYVYAIIGTRLTCSDEDEFLVNISTTPVLPFYANVEICEEYILPALPLGNYFSGPSGTGTSYSAGQSITTNQQMYVYAESPTNPLCNDEKEFEIVVHPLKNVTITGGSICVDNSTGALLQPFLLKSGVSSTSYTIEWYLNGVLMGTGTNYSATQEGTYTVEFIKNTPNIGSDCGYNSTTVVVEKSSSAIANLTVTGAFQEEIDIIINVTGGFGNYEFQMDGGTIQASNVFSNVTGGIHSIVVTDTKGKCGVITLTAHVLRYPHYFTPNGDGYNDTWTIWDLAYQTKARIFIYDRFGKLIKQISPTGQGWDGTYNGELLPSTDYWFEVFYKLNGIDQEYKSHFSLKR